MGGLYGEQRSPGPSEQLHEHFRSLVSESSPSSSGRDAQASDDVSGQFLDTWVHRAALNLLVPPEVSSQNWEFRRPCLYSLYSVCVLNFKILTTRTIQASKKKKGGGGVISLQALVAGSDISETWVCVCSLKDILDKITFFKYTVSVRLLY